MFVCKGHSLNRMFEFRCSFLLLDKARSFKRERDTAHPDANQMCRSASLLFYIKQRFFMGIMGILSGLIYFGKTRLKN